MRTTIDIPDDLLRQAKAQAARERRTFSEFVEAALRSYLKHGGSVRRRFRLRRASVKGRGLQKGIAEGCWGQIRDLIYPS